MQNQTKTYWMNSVLHLIIWNKASNQVKNKSKRKPKTTPSITSFGPYWHYWCLEHDLEIKKINNILKKRQFCDNRLSKNKGLIYKDMFRVINPSTLTFYESIFLHLGSKCLTPKTSSSHQRLAHLSSESKWTLFISNWYFFSLLSPDPSFGF